MWAWQKQVANFYFHFTRRRVVQYSCFDFFYQCKKRYFQLSGLWNTYLTYQIRRTATNVHFEIHKMLNFPSICSGDWNICAEYDLRGRLSLTWALTLLGTRKLIHYKAFFFLRQYNEIFIWFCSIESFKYMQTWHIKTLLIHAVSFAKPFMVFDCLYANGIFWNWFGLKSACF